MKLGASGRWVETRTGADVTAPWTATKKSYTLVWWRHHPLSGSLPRSRFPQFHVGCRQVENFPPCPRLPFTSMEPWATTKKVLSYCSGETSPCPGSCPTAPCPKFHVGCRLGRKLFTLPSQNHIILFDASNFCNLWITWLNHIFTLHVSLIISIPILVVTGLPVV